MQLPSALLVFAVASLFVGGSASPTVSESDQTKISQVASTELAASVDEAQGAGRFLRAVERGDTEDRADWSALKKLIPGTKAFSVEKEAAKMKKLAPTFKAYREADKMPYFAFKVAEKRGASLKKAVRYAKRYEDYLKNPSAYH